MSKRMTVAMLTQFAMLRASDVKPSVLKRKEEETGATESIKLRVNVAIPTVSAVREAIETGGGGTYSSSQPVAGDPTERKLNNKYELGADALTAILTGTADIDQTAGTVETAPGAVRVTETDNVPVTAAQGPARPGRRRS